MCRRGSWNGIDTRFIEGDLYAIEQCSECDSYRALSIDDAPVVGRDDVPDDQGW